MYFVHPGRRQSSRPRASDFELVLHPIVSAWLQGNGCNTTAGKGYRTEHRRCYEWGCFNGMRSSWSSSPLSALSYDINTGSQEQCAVVQKVVFSFGGYLLNAVKRSVWSMQRSRAALTPWAGRGAWPHHFPGAGTDNAGLCRGRHVRLGNFDGTAPASIDMPN